jgi:hypothetical protein
MISMRVNRIIRAAQAEISAELAKEKSDANSAVGNGASVPHVDNTPTK